jgi:Ca-activated chloride channel homolog
VPPRAQDKGSAIRVNVDLLSVSVRVTDKQGRDAVGLAAGDFALFEDGRRRKISFFETEKEPITLGILLDSSNSMNAAEKISSALEIVKQLINRSGPEDEISVLQCTGDVVRFKGILRDQRGPTLSTGMTSESGGAAIYDALASALGHVRASLPSALASPLLLPLGVFHGLFEFGVFGDDFHHALTGDVLSHFLAGFG